MLVICKRRCGRRSRKRKKEKVTVACCLFADVGRIHLCRGSRWEDHVHFRDGVGPFRTLSGPFVLQIYGFSFILPAHTI